MKEQQRAAIEDILGQANDLTLATIRDDGYPQATTVSYVSDGLTVYFSCAEDSQKTKNLSKNDKISFTVNLPYDSWNTIRGLSAGGRAEVIHESGELERASALFMAKFPQVAEFVEAEDWYQAQVVRINLEVVSILDYRNGFGATEEVRT